MRGFFLSREGCSVSEKKSLYIKIIAVTVALVIVFAAFFVLQNTIVDSFFKYVTTSMKEVNAQNVDIVQSKMKAAFTTLNGLASLISDFDGTDAECIDLCKPVAEYNNFKRITIIAPDGAGITTDGHTDDLSGKDNFMQSLTGKQVVTDIIEDILPSADGTAGDKIIIFSVPVYAEDESVKAVISATFDASVFSNLFSTYSFDGKGASYILKKNGDSVADATHISTTTSKDNLFEAMLALSADNAEPVKQLKSDFEANASGLVKYQCETQKYMYYSPVGYNDWMLVTIVYASVVTGDASTITLSTYILVYGAILIIGVMLWLIIRTEKKKIQALERVLFVDSITGGNTYQKFEIAARASLDAHKDETAVMLAIDIAGFKIINDLYGIGEGDRVLKFFYDRISANVDSSSGEFCCRRLADRYLALIYSPDRPSLEKRLEKLAGSFGFDKKGERDDFILKPVIGAYVITNKSSPIPVIHNYAVMAHSEAKQHLSVKYCVYDNAIKEKILGEKIMHDRIVTALEKDEFLPFYQPKYSAADARLAGAEALIRWKNSDGSYTPPYKFVPVAEKSGVIANLDFTVFKQVCASVRAWQERGLSVLPVSVNISKAAALSNAFPQNYLSVIADEGINTGSIELEITESLLFEDKALLCRKLDTLRAAGIKILLDDFGTGYSSLTMLKDLPLDGIKLDKSFIDAYVSPKGDSLIKTMLGLARSLNLDVTAEGVETAEQYEYLKKLDCKTIQGYYFSKPVSGADLESLLKQNRPQ